MTLLILTGCSTMNGNTQSLTVNVSPSNAKFTVDSCTYTGSQTVEVWRRPQTITAHLDGHSQETRTVKTKMSDLAKIDIFIGLFLFWPNLVGLAHPGARQLKQDVVSITLTKNAQQYARPEDQYQQYVPMNSVDELQRAKYMLERRIKDARVREDARADDEWDFQQWKAAQTP
jgi:hypothetical protein